MSCRTKLRDVICAVILVVTVVAAPSNSRAADVLAPGATVDNAAIANLTPSGLSFAVQTARAALPPKIDIDRQKDSVDLLLCKLRYDFKDAAVGIKLVDIKVNTQSGNPGFLKVDMAIDAWGGNSDDLPNGNTYDSVLGRLEYDLCLTSCNDGRWSLLRMKPPVSPQHTVIAHANVYVDVVPDPAGGRPLFKVNSDFAKSDLEVQLGEFDAKGCTLPDILTDIVNALSPVIEDQIRVQVIKLFHEEVLPDLEKEINKARIKESIDVAGKTLDLDLYPSNAVIRDEGLMLATSGSVTGATGPTKCVEIPADAGSRYTPSAEPVFTESVPGGGPYHAAISVSDDVVNQALFAAWYEGLLCQTIENVSGGGFELNMDLLNLIGMARALRKLDIDTSAPLVVDLAVKRAPWADYGGEAPANLHIEEAGLSLMTEVHDRLARLATLDVGATATLDARLNSDGALAITPGLPLDDFTMVPVYDELLGKEETTELTTLLPTLIASISPMLSDAIEPVDVADLGGVGIKSFDLRVDGPGEDFLSAYASLADTGISSTGLTCSVVSLAEKQAGWGSSFILAASALLWRRKKRDL